MQSNKLFAGVLALLLWLVTAAWGLLDVYFLRQTFLLIYARFGGTLSSGVALSNFLVLVLSILWLAFAIGTAEYHRKRVGDPRSWKLFGWTIAVELSILILYFLV